MASLSGGLVKRFGLVIALVALAGLLLALFADRPSISPDDGYWDAIREVGAAIVSGAILAGLVVWFEDRREEERVDRENARDDVRFEREEQREDEAARRAWRREIDVRLVAVVRTDLDVGRRSVLEDLAEHTRPRHISTVVETLSRPPRGRTFGEARSETAALLEFLRDGRLLAAWREWNLAFDEHDEVPAPQVERNRSDSHGLGGVGEIAPSRDPVIHAQTAEDEAALWQRFLDALEIYVSENYPVG